MYDIKSIYRYIIAEKDNKIIKSAKQLKQNDEIELKFQDGKQKAKII